MRALITTSSIPFAAVPLVRPNPKNTEERFEMHDAGMGCGLGLACFWVKRFG